VGEGWGGASASIDLAALASRDLRDRVEGKTPPRVLEGGTVVPRAKPPQSRLLMPLGLMPPPPLSSLPPAKSELRALRLLAAPYSIAAIHLQVVPKDQRRKGRMRFRVFDVCRFASTFPENFNDDDTSLCCSLTAIFIHTLINCLCHVKRGRAGAASEFFGKCAFPPWKTRFPGTSNSELDFVPIPID